MKKIYIFIVVLFLALAGQKASAQTPTDGIMMHKGEICFGLTYTNESWDEYWEGTLLRENGNIGTLTRESIMGMFTLGLTDRINIIAAVPWVSSKTSQGQLKGVSGLQDFMAYLKFQAFHIDAGPGKLAFNPGIGIAVPMSNYLEDYAPFSLGLGCPDLTLRGNLQYKLNMGLYVRGIAAYQVRGSSTIERDYYYTTHGNYSDKVDVPNGFTYAATLGVWLLNNTLNLDVTYDGLTTNGGNDIRRQDVGFPTNKMNFNRIGGFVHYYLPFAPGLGIVASGNQILEGRNVGKAVSYTAGITYQFPLFGSHMEEPIN